MTAPVLGRLSRIDARAVWAHEAHGFTPWLRQNIALLGEALGLEVEVESEVAVGAFAVDLAGKELATGRPLIIENQLTATDHGHLGQLLTYAAGLDAAVVVWIAPKFRDEHRQAIDWLNLHTDDKLDFFGIELELLRINDSLPAPHFKVVAQPNQWTETVKKAAAGGPASELAARYQRFLEAALEAFKARRPGVTSASRVGAQNWFSFSAGRTGFVFSWAFAQGKKFRTELYIDTGDHNANKAAFDKLAGMAEQLTSTLGLPISWERLDDRRASRLAVYYPGAVGAVPDEDTALVSWAVQSMAKMNDLFRPLVKTI